ncbi:hypothetical protein RPT62_001383 [Salmonella enterica]|nr:hypothetical protein [Salmonella enterica]EDT3816746.1 hypothetical protein [Salmonella enterica subsp. enterica serovar Javiana]ECR4553478.1 hypothetical protein [Salmonella enterica]EGD5599986.1 hypothetical protein [Salmonella enterica]EGG9290294.1 hypothetical protein [Salmonella enterica]
MSKKIKRRPTSKVICSYCFNDALLRKGELIPDFIGNFHFQNYYWICFNCNAWVGCHKNTKIPYGRLANKNLRSLRRELHNIFDTIWESGSLTRSGAYSWLADKLSIPIRECHIGLFNESICIQAISILKKHGYQATNLGSPRGIISSKNYPPDSF